MDNEQRDEERRQILFAVNNIEQYIKTNIAPDLQKLTEKVITGNGKPPLCTTVDINSSDIATIKDDIKALNRFMYKTVGACVVLVIFVPVLMKFIFKV